MRPCIVIPYYNHGGAIAQVLGALAVFDLPCIVVDDGSDAQAKAQLSLALGDQSQISVIALAHNQGKGVAVMTGCEAALARGFTHVVQIDADGQHQPSDIPRLLDLARLHPEALVTGQPIYDASVPRSRHYGRYVTHVWVWINTLSFEIRDSMCGFRVYPLLSACAVWRTCKVGRHMDFDTEIMVRMAWRGVRVLSVPTRVTYPVDGVSHFALWRDNVRISAMHAKLFGGMLLRLPMLLARRIRRLFNGVRE
jgi:glycosyltransferase involved in cell wall biosynthesis